MRDYRIVGNIGEKFGENEKHLADFESQTLMTSQNGDSAGLEPSPSRFRHRKVLSALAAYLPIFALSSRTVGIGTANHTALHADLASSSRVRLMRSSPVLSPSLRECYT